MMHFVGDLGADRYAKFFADDYKQIPNRTHHYKILR